MVVEYVTESSLMATCDLLGVAEDACVVFLTHADQGLLGVSALRLDPVANQ